MNCAWNENMRYRSMIVTRFVTRPIEWTHNIGLGIKYYFHYYFHRIKNRSTNARVSLAYSWDERRQPQTPRKCLIYLICDSGDLIILLQLKIISSRLPLSSDVIFLVWYLNESVWSGQSVVRWSCDRFDSEERPSVIVYSLIIIHHYSGDREKKNQIVPNSSEALEHNRTRWFSTFWWILNYLENK